MARTRLYPIISVTLLVLAVIACALPGQTVQPAPVTNPVGVETAIAGTAQAAQAQTQQALIPGTPTPIPTETLTPTPQVSNAGTSLLYLQDGSIQLTDQVAGVQMTFPAGWLVIRVGEQEYYDAWTRPEMQNPRFLDMITAIQNLDPKVFRANALDIRPDRFLYNDITQVDVVFSRGDGRTLKQVRADEIRDHLPLKSYKLLSSQTFKTAQGLEALNLEIRGKTSNAASETGYIYRRRIVFKLPTGIMAVDLNIVMDKKDLTMPDFDQIINSFILISPT